MASETAGGAPLVEETANVLALPADLSTLHRTLERFWGAVDRALPYPPEAASRHKVATAVMEIATNIIRHAHPSGTPAGRMRLRLRAYADRIEARFTDRGVAYRGPPPVGPAPPPPPASPAPDDLSDFPEGGYGLTLVRATVDEVAYKRSDAGTNVWRLVKRLDPPPPPAPPPPQSRALG